MTCALPENWNAYKPSNTTTIRWSTNEPSHAVKPGSAESCSHELRSRCDPPRGESNPSLLSSLIIAFLLSLSTPALAQEHGGSIEDRVENITKRVEARAEKAEQASDRHAGAIITAAQRIYWGVVILGSMYLVGILGGKALDIVKIVVAAKYMKT